MFLGVFLCTKVIHFWTNRHYLNENILRDMTNIKSIY